MRPTTAVAVALFIAEDRASRDRQAADAWRRLHAKADADGGSFPAGAAPERRSVAGRLAGVFHVRLARPLA